MVEIIQSILIFIIFVGHVKLYFDTAPPKDLTKKHENMPPGFAEYWDGGKFICYIDLR